MTFDSQHASRGWAGGGAALAEPEGEAAWFADRLATAAAADAVRARRIRRCRESIRFRASDGDAILASDGDGVRVDFSPEHVDDPNATVFSFAPSQLQRFACGDVCLAAMLLCGQAIVTGSAGAALAVSPIIRGLLRDADPPGTAPDASGGDAADTGVDAADGEAEVPDDAWAVQVHDLHKSFGTAQVLQGVSMRIPEGAITAILGPSGTGKSVVLKHIIGLLQPDRGEIVVHGRALSGLSVQEMLDLRRRFGVLFQDGALFGSMSLFDNVAFPLRQHTDLSESAIARLVDRRLDDVGLGTLGHASPPTLSGGQRKRAGLARALVLEPDIVLFDEPDSGLDPVRTSLLSDLMLETHPQFGGTYVVITHDIRLARKVADYIVVLWQGAVVEAGTGEQVFRSQDPFVRQFLHGMSHGPLGMD